MHQQNCHHWLSVWAHTHAHKTHTHGHKTQPPTASPIQAALPSLSLPGLSRAFRILLIYVFCTFTVLNFTNSLYCVLIQENNCFKDETQGCLPQSHVRMVSPVLMTYQHGPLGIGQPWKPQRCLMCTHVHVHVKTWPAQFLLHRWSLGL